MKRNMYWDAAVILAVANIWMSADMRVFQKVVSSSKWGTSKVLNYSFVSDFICK